MALVPYEFSDTEDDMENFSNSVIDNKEIFKSNIKLDIDQKNNELNVTETRCKPKDKNKCVKIIIPAINCTEEEYVSKKKFKWNCQDKSLFSVLPPPKYKNTNSTSFIPLSLRLKPKIEKAISEEDIDGSTNNFFSTTLAESKPVQTGAEAISIRRHIDINSAIPVQDTTCKNNQYFSKLVNKHSKVNKNHLINENQRKQDTMDCTRIHDNPNEYLSNETVKQLIGKNNKYKGKNKIVHKIIDVDISNVISYEAALKNKYFTIQQETAVEVSDEPSFKHRRKHQITYLAYQAKVNEQQLKNQWAMNRLTRKQTQAKYGF